MTVPHRIGRYSLLSRIGSGGSGEVWEAILEGPVGFRKRVALKLVAATQRDADGLRQEARLGALLRHPNIVDVYELGVASDGRVFLAMEMVPGMSLGMLLKQHGGIAGPALREIAIQLCRGLGYVHRLKLDDGTVGLVHRDVKPTNVLLDPSGMVKLADLGIARLVGKGDGTIEGTPGYLAPEQLDGSAPKPTADVYSTGMLLWAMAVGKTPVRGGRGLAQALRAAMTAQSKALRARTVLADALPGLDEVVLRCLDPDPAGRYVDGRELMEAIRALPEPPGDGLIELLARIDASGTNPVSRTLTERTSRSTGLRAESHPMVGRIRERDAVETGLATANALVTIKGIGGIGKTRLANHVAHRLARTDRRVLWAELDPARTEGGVLTAVASALRIPLDADDPEGNLVRAFRDLGPAVLVLDRIDAAYDVVHDRLTAWREGAPELSILVTSRRPLGLPSEVVVELGPLQADDALALFLRLSARPLVDADMPQVRQLVRRLDYHPLAIELAAPRTALLEPQELLERLDDRFALLKAEGREDALEGAIAWSVDQLPPWSQHALVQLAVFRGTFPVQAAESVVDVSQWEDAPWPLDLIDDLWRRSLLYVRHTRSGPRLGMYESVRAYILLRVDTSTGTAADGAQRRHGAWYARMGTQSRLDALHTKEGPSLSRALARELEDLIGAFEGAVARDDVAVAEPTALAAAEVLLRRGPLGRGRAVLETLGRLRGLRRRDQALRLQIQLSTALTAERRQALWQEAIEAAPTPRRRARMVANAARDLAVNTDEPGALERCQQATEVARQSGDQLALWAALSGLGVAQRIVGNSDAAKEALEEAFAICKTLGDTEAAAHTKLSLGNTLYNLAEYDAAYEAYRYAEREFRISGRKGSLATAINNQTLILGARNDHHGAETAAREAMAIGRAIGDRGIELSAKSHIASSLMGRGRDEEAATMLEEVITLSRDMQSWYTVSMAQCNLAHVLAKLGRSEEGIAPLTEAIAISQRSGRRRSEALARGNLGILHTDLGAFEAARAELDAAVALSEGVDPRFEGGFRSARARLAVLVGDDPTDDLAHSHTLLTRANDQLELDKRTCVEAVWLGQNGDVGGARRLLTDLPATDPVLRERIREAKRLLSRL